MHLASEVSSTTTPQTGDTGALIHNSGGHGDSVKVTSHKSKANSSNSSGNTNSNNGNTNSNSGAVTAESIVDRTIDALLAEHPGELVRTGCPHVVGVHSLFFCLLIFVLVSFIFINISNPVAVISEFNELHLLIRRCALCYQHIGDQIKHYRWHSKWWHWVMCAMALL